MVDDTVVLHLAVAADAQGVISRIVGALPHQEQARLRGVQEPLRLLSGYFPVKPPAEAARGGKKNNQVLEKIFLKNFLLK